MIFDLGNVLIDIHPELAVSEFSRRLKIPGEKINSFYLSELHLEFMAGKYDPAQFVEKISAQLGISLNIIDFKNIWRLIPGKTKPGWNKVIPILNEIYTLSVCSNTDPLHWEYIKSSEPIIDYFQHEFLSFRIGANKPSEAIFGAILTELSASADECVFVDDSAQNTKAATNFGMHSILADNSAEVIKRLSQMNLI